MYIFSPRLSSITEDYFLFQLMLTGGFPRLPAGETGVLSVDCWNLKLVKAIAIIVNMN